jgi:hypothetical protein
MGLAELITGRTFHELAHHRDELKPWQRGVFGVLIVAIASIVIIAVAMIVIVAIA